MFTSLRSRLWLTYASLMAVMLGVLGISLVVYLLRNPLDDRLTMQRMIAATDNLLSLANQNIDTLPSTRLNEVLRRADERTSFRVLLFGPTGEVIADSRSDEAPAIQLSTRQIRQVRGVTRDSGGRVWLYALQKLESGSYLVLANPRSPRLASLYNIIVNLVGDELLSPFLQAVAIALFFTILLSIFMSRWIAAPLQRMAKAARAVAAGKYQSLPPEGPDEVRGLGNAFNEMTARVQASQQSQRDFVANISHELKTPLTSIQGFSQAILDGAAKTDDEINQAAEVIYSESARMHRMVLELLDLARLDAGTMEFARAPVNIKLLLNQVVEKFTPQAAEAQVNLDSALADLPIIIGDSDRLAQVFTNLLDNAIKYTPPGGQVSLRAEFDNGIIRLAITDSGPGIPTEALPRIFERFYQLDESRRGGPDRGAGLGLTIAYEIVQAHRGTLVACSEMGKGSTFVVELPIVFPDDSTLAARPYQPPEVTGKVPSDG